MVRFKKSFLLTCLMLAFGLGLPSYAQTEQWRVTYDSSIGAHPNLSPARDIGRHIGFDADGNVYVVVSSNPWCGGCNYTPDTEFVLFKYDAGGNELWRLAVGYGDVSIFADFHVDPQGNVYGAFYSYYYYYHSPTNYGGDKGDANIFKVDSDGNMVWSEQWNNSAYDENDYPVAFDVDTGGNVYFLIKSNFLSGIYDNYHPVIQKYSPTGGLLWQVIATGHGSVDIDTDNAGNAYVLQNGAVDTTVKKYNSADGTELCSGVVEYWWDDDGLPGNPEFWASARGVDIEVGPDGNVYIAAAAAQRHWFWVGPGNDDWDSVILDNFFTAQYDSDCNLIWSNEYGSYDDDEYPMELMFDDNGDILVTGVDYQYYGGDLTTLRYSPDGTREGTYRSAQIGSIVPEFHIDGTYAYVIELSPLALHKYSLSTGAEEWNIPLNDLITGDDIVVEPSGNFYLTGSVDDVWTHQPYTAWFRHDMVLIKYSQEAVVGNTPTGSNVQVIEGDVTITFDTVTTAGDTTVTESGTGPDPGNLQTCVPPVYYDITTTADYSGMVEICLSYDDSVCDESDLHLFHYEGGIWVDVTTSVDTVANIICGEVTSLSEFLLATYPRPPGPIFVDLHATGRNNGRSWADAYINLQDAMASAISGDEIWVAEGTYKPDEGGGQTSGDRTASFQLRNGVTIRGGYAGFGEPDPNARDINAYETILNGDLNSDDFPPYDYYRLDAADIAGMEPELSTGQIAGSDGMEFRRGTYFIYQTNLGRYGKFIVEDLNDISNNKLTIGWVTYDGDGTVYSSGSGLEIRGTYSCDLDEGQEEGTPAAARDLNWRQATSTTRYLLPLNGARFKLMYRASGGESGDNTDNSYHVVTGSFTDATAILDGFTITAGNANASSMPHDAGGGMRNESGNPTVRNCTFTGNSAIWGGGIENFESSPAIANCTFSENFAGNGGGVNNYNSNMSLTNCTFSGNSATWGGGMRNRSNSNPTITNCKFSGNSASTSGGGMCNTANSNPTITNCTFSSNSTTGLGGGMYNFEQSSPTLTNCYFEGNSASNGGGMNNNGGSPTLTNCTFSGNLVGGRCGGMLNYNNSPTLTNCILWGNSDGGGMNESAQIYNPAGSTPVINFCCVQGWTGGLGGTGNIGDDPLFVDLPDNLRLSSGSLCIDVGNNTAVPSGVTTDLDGHPRIVDGDGNISALVDMGAYEFAWAYIGDFDGELDVDFADFATFALAWLSEPGDARWNPDCDISIPADNYIDWRDLDVLSDNWPARARFSPIPNLLFSEYVEGRGYNQAVEIYNAGDVVVFLGSCQVRIYNDGSSSPRHIVPLKWVTLAPGEVYVLGHPSIREPRLCDQLNADLSFNGNDAIELVYQGVPHDVIGQIRFDPGPLGWGSRDITTTDHTLRRKCSVSTGDSFGYDSFHPAVEWVAFPVNTFDGLGSHCQ